MAGFLPCTTEEMRARGWDVPDFVLVTGDAYVDHPTFGTAIIARVLESEGFRVAILPQPDWHTADDFRRFGRPKYGFFVTSGNIDSMVAHYTAARKPRSTDYYSPGGKPRCRPDRADIVYTGRIREAYGDIPVVLGGLEASLRRFAHYDYWEDRVRRSVLFDSGADLLVYGMGERQTVEIARRLAAEEPVRTITGVRGTCLILRGAGPDAILGSVVCPSFERVRGEKRAYAEACRMQYDEQDAVTGRTIVQAHGDALLVQYPPAKPLAAAELDRVHELPYLRTFHPMYKKQGGVPALKEVEFSITHNRGCFGACNFCAISFHQGRAVTARSPESVLREAKLLTQLPGFRGTISDVGGPTADLRGPSCRKQRERGLCRGKKCLAPKPCPALEVDHREYLGILRSLRRLPGVKHVFVRSGLRFDYILADKDDAFLRELIVHHVSGQLRVAPEHCSAAVLDRMGKPHIEAYLSFVKKFGELTLRAGKEQYVVPYLMSSHPGSTLKDAVELALFLRDHHIRPEQVQDFYPTPGTISTCMFYTGLDPYTMRPVSVPRTPEEKAMQRALLQYYLPANRSLVLEALRRAGRGDLIGFGPRCLIRPENGFRVAQPPANGRTRPDKKGHAHVPHGSIPAPAAAHTRRNPRDQQKKHGKGRRP